MRGKVFFRAIKDWKKNPSKYLGRPKLPKYKDKDGRYVVGLTNNKFTIKNKHIYFRWKKLKVMNNYFCTRIPDNVKLMQIRFVPRYQSYDMEIVYQVDVPTVISDNNKIVGIDLGVDNFITMSNNFGEKPIVIKGGIIKSINQFYNKRKADIQSHIKTMNQMNWCNRLSVLTRKRDRKIKYQMQCISKYVVDWCVLHDVDTVVIGHNNRWKQNNRGMQNFTYIPYELFIKMIAYKCENNGIRFIENEEAYTSGTSFIDQESPVKENYNKDRRICRGLFVANNGKKINADVNGAYQIIKKVFPDAFSNGIEDAYSHPMIIKLVS